MAFTELTTKTLGVATAVVVKRYNDNTIEFTASGRTTRIYGAKPEVIALYEALRTVVGNSV